MPGSPAMRFSPETERRGDCHNRRRSIENGVFIVNNNEERDEDDDLALFNEVQNKECDNFLLQSNDDFEDTFATKLRHFSDHKVGMKVANEGESSDLLNVEEDKNDYEWLITPPDTPLFVSLDDETPQVNVQQRGRPRAQPISISRSSTMDKSHRSSRGSPSPNQLSPSPRSCEPVFQPRGRASSVPSSSPPPTRRPATGSRRPSSPSIKPSTPPRRASTPNSRRLSTGSVSTINTGAKVISGNSVSPKVKAWQVNIPGFSTEVPPNLRTSLADRPASYVRGSSPASRNGRHSMSPIGSRSISSSHSQDRDRFSAYSKGSIASSYDDDVESLPSITVDGSERSNSKKASGFRNNKAILPQKPIRAVSSSSAPKRSFDVALRQMDHRKGPQNMFRPLLSSVPTSNFYAGKPSPAWNSSLTTSSNASSDPGTSGPHYIEERDPDEDDATSGHVKVQDCNIDDEVFMIEQPESLNEGEGGETREFSPYEDGCENVTQLDIVTAEISNAFNEIYDLPKDDSNKDVLICSRCGCSYSVITQTEDDIKLCPNCWKSNSALTISDMVTQTEDDDMLEETQHNMESQTTVDEVTSESESQFEQQKNLVMEGENTCHEESQHTIDFAKSSSLSTKVYHQVICQSSLSYSDEGSEQIQSDDSPNSKVDYQKSMIETMEVEGISIVLKRSTSIRQPIIQRGNFSASSISYDDFSYARASTNSMRSSIGRGSVSASSSVDFGPRFQRQLSSRKSDIENYKYDPVNEKFRRSVSSVSGISSHAFHPSGVGTSTLDISEVSTVPVERDIADSASEGPQENPNENSTFVENEGVVNIGTTALDSKELVLSELPDNEVPFSLQKVEDMEMDTSSLFTLTYEKVEDLRKDISDLTTCTFEEDSSLNLCAENTDYAEVQLDAISEGEVDHGCSLSSSQCSESSVEEIRDPHESTSFAKDLEVSVVGCDTSNHSTSIMEESMVLVECHGGTKVRSLTLEEATDTILFCSSIVQNLASEAATLAIEKETPPDLPDNNLSFPLIPAVAKGYSDPKEVQAKKTIKPSSKSQKKKKIMEKDTMMDPTRLNDGEKTDLSKTPRIVYSNNKENTRPPKLESKCNCIIM
ncbi:uncharacterized protein [Rutidosis leptorrhynchoides]|uniref:uncharacterized protein n=1 Tax=Rutidosis leptorrhynchoides TaxID=125765 RepID=UPI003A99C904